MALSFGILSTYPPDAVRPGHFLAGARLSTSTSSGADVGVVRVVDSPQPAVPLVAHQLVISEPGRRRARRRGAQRLRRRGHPARVRHLRRARRGRRPGRPGRGPGAGDRGPAHGAHHPTPHQHEVLARVVAAASVAVTMTETARQRLIRGGASTRTTSSVIAHGAEDNRGNAGASPPGDVVDSDGADLGSARRGKGNRVGAGGDAPASPICDRSASTGWSARPIRGCSSAKARPTATACTRPRTAWASRRWCSSTAATWTGRHCSASSRRRRRPAALRLAGPGDVRGADRGGGRRQAGGVDDLPARRGAAVERRGAPRAAA